MRTIVLVLFFLCIAPFVAFRGEAEEGSSNAWTEIVQSEAGMYSVSVEPDRKKIEITRLDEESQFSPQLRMKILRRNDRPLEIRLHTMERVDFPLYVGRFDQWQSSYVGLELEFSFDRKTWKKLGNTLKKALP